MEIFSTQYLLCRKFAAVCRKMLTSCPSYFLRATAVPRISYGNSVCPSVWGVTIRCRT